jgi:hypothetical protein
MSETPMSESTAEPGYIAFAGQTCVASGSLLEVGRRLKEILRQDPTAPLLVLDYRTSQVIDLDLRGTAGEVEARLATVPAGRSAGSDDASSSQDLTASRTAATAPRAPGRPKLGVVAREVTLLPRHWQWLNEQPGGASVTLRRLVEDARKSTAGEVQRRNAQEACYRFMSIMAGNEPGYEEALRALYAVDSDRYDRFTELWPPDIRDHARRLAAGAFTNTAS